jgi:hypothetical protein
MVAMLSGVRRDALMFWRITRPCNLLIAAVTLRATLWR